MGQPRKLNEIGFLPLNPHGKFKFELGSLIELGKESQQDYSGTYMVLNHRTGSQLSVYPTNTAESDVYQLYSYKRDEVTILDSLIVDHFFRKRV